MVSFEHFTIEDGIPIYLQIARHIKQGVVARGIQDGDEMPSRRMLSALLGVNPNTVQKAYRLLEEEGIIESRAGAISYVTLTKTKIEQVRKELLENDTQSFVNAMQKMGVSKGEALSLIERLWK